MIISKIESDPAFPPVEEQRRKKAVKEIEEKEKTVQPTDANDSEGEEGKGRNINIKA